MIPQPSSAGGTRQALFAGLRLLLLPVPAAVVIFMMQPCRMMSPALPQMSIAAPSVASFRVVTLRISGAGLQTVTIRTVLTGHTVKYPVPVYSLYPARDGKGALSAEMLVQSGEEHHV